MSKCKACGKAARKTTIAVVFGGGRQGPGRVCGDCARGGMLVVALNLPTVVKEKVVKSEGVERALRSLKTMAIVNEKAFKAAPENVFAQGKAEGYESAIEVIKRECGE